MTSRKHKYSVGENVRIVAGNYKKYGSGVYLGTYGTVMCSVKVKGDNRASRNLWLTSIEPMPKEARKAQVNPTDDPKEQEKASKSGRWEFKDYVDYHERNRVFVKLAKKEMKTLLTDVQEIMKKMEDLEKKIDEHLSKDNDV
jgi:tetrahydromethanopterin S-methyltransferase subunit B